MQRAEGVDKSIGKEFCHFLAFLVGKSGILAVGLWVLEVDFFVCHVQVAA